MKKVSSPIQPDRRSVHIGVIASLLVLGVCTVTLTQTNIIALLASSASSTLESPATIYFVSSKEGALTVGETVDVDLMVRAKVPINTFGAKIVFPHDVVDVVGISKEKSFLDLWTEDTEISEDAHEVKFSGGTTKHGGVEGDVVALTITLKAKRAGAGELVLKDVMIYPNDGSGISLEHSEDTLAIDAVDPAPIIAGGTTAQNGKSALSGDFNNDGKITLVDVSIFAFKMLAAYDSRYDLNHDGKVGLTDLSILFSRR